MLVAVTGGSGSGKTWLIERLASALGRQTVSISADDFYLDRSHLTPVQRARINFDHPRAIDWTAFERALRQIKAGRAAQVPCYDFTTHCRLSRTRTVQPRRVVLVDGLWLLRRRSFRRLIDLAIFIDCPVRIRLRRRIERDLEGRGRSRASIQAQFRKHVEPMHVKYVAPQARRADCILGTDYGTEQIRELVERILTLRRGW